MSRCQEKENVLLYGDFEEVEQMLMITRCVFKEGRVGGSEGGGDEGKRSCKGEGCSKG